MTDFGAVLRTLTEGHIDFIVIGGVAASLHGSPRATFDVDVVYERSARNIAKLIAALGEVQAAATTISYRMPGSLRRLDASAWCLTWTPSSRSSAPLAGPRISRRLPNWKRFEKNSGTTRPCDFCGCPLNCDAHHSSANGRLNCVRNG